jgi:hypothetical protein
MPSSKTENLGKIKSLCDLPWGVSYQAGAMEQNPKNMYHKIIVLILGGHINKLGRIAFKL